MKQQLPPQLLGRIEPLIARDWALSLWSTSLGGSGSPSVMEQKCQLPTSSDASKDLNRPGGVPSGVIVPRGPHFWSQSVARMTPSTSTWTTSLHLSIKISRRSVKVCLMGKNHAPHKCMLLPSNWLPVSHLTASWLLWLASTSKDTVWGAECLNAPKRHCQASNDIRTQNVSRFLLTAVWFSHAFGSSLCDCIHVGQMEDPEEWIQWRGETLPTIPTWVGIAMSLPLTVVSSGARARLMAMDQHFHADHTPPSSIHLLRPQTPDGAMHQCHGH